MGWKLDLIAQLAKCLGHLPGTAALCLGGGGGTLLDIVNAVMENFPN
jgi:hypothetical protein